MRDAHHKLSKRHGDKSFEDLVNEGYLVEAIVNYIALLGWSPADNTEIFSLHQMVVYNVCEIICRETVRFH